MEPGSGARRQRRDARTLDKDEEDYFSTGSDDTSEDDDDDLATNAAAGAGRAGRGGSPTGTSWFQTSERDANRSTRLLVGRSSHVFPSNFRLANVQQ